MIRSAVHEVRVIKRPLGTYVPDSAIVPPYIVRIPITNVSLPVGQWFQVQFIPIQYNILKLYVRIVTNRYKILTTPQFHKIYKYLNKNVL